MMTYSPFRHIGSVLWKRRPIQLTFFLTKRCNAKCPFCFYGAGENGSVGNNTELGLEEIKEVSASMGDLLWLAFSGGEIFLRNDIVQISRTFYENNKPAIILFSTNGLMTDIICKRVESVLETCRKSTVAVKLSLDGLGELHDSIRGDGSFEKVLSTYKALGRLIDKYPNFELGINTVFCSANQDNMGDIVDYVKELDKIKTHTVSLIRGDGLKDVDLEKYRRTINDLAKSLRTGTSSTYRFRGGRLKAAQDILQRQMIYDIETKKRKLVDCNAGRLNLVLTEKGDVYPCESFDMKMGNVRDSGYDMSGIVESAKSKEIISNIKEKGCFCSHECYLMTNILFDLRVYPSLLREYLKVGSN